MQIREILTETVCMHGPFRHHHPPIPSISSAQVGLASGMGRHWPDGRGIFANDAMNFLVWANEEDHMRVISMQTGADVREVLFTRHLHACLHSQLCPSKNINCNP